MSPIRMGKATVNGVSAAALGDRATALSLALFSGADELDGRAVEQARRVLDHAQERSAIAGDHTVVALAGATGGGKSSLFNALVGESVAVIGARRPKTAKPTRRRFCQEVIQLVQDSTRQLSGSLKSAIESCR